MKVIIIELMLILLVSCGSTTYVKRPDGTVLFNDGSVAENVDYQKTTANLPDGVVITTEKWKKDQQGGIQSWLRWTKSPELIQSTGKALEGGVEAVGSSFSN